MNVEQTKPSEQIDDYLKKPYEFGYVTDLESESPEQVLNYSDNQPDI